MAERKYWLDLLTGKTWEEFLRNGAKVSGYREGRKKVAQRIQVGDYLICYLTGISKIIGVLEVMSDCYVDESPLWEDAVFPIRFKVKLESEQMGGDRMKRRAISRSASEI